MAANDRTESTVAVAAAKVGHLSPGNPPARKSHSGQLPQYLTLTLTRGQVFPMFFSGGGRCLSAFLPFPTSFKRDSSASLGMWHVDSEHDHHRVIGALLRPPRYWRKPCGRRRTTWLRATDTDVQSASGSTQRGERPVVAYSERRPIVENTDVKKTFFTFLKKILITFLAFLRF